MFYEEILTPYLVKEAIDHIELRNMNESIKKEFAGKIIERILVSMANKIENSPEFVLIEKTRGSFNKLTSVRDTVNKLEKLKVVLANKRLYKSLRLVDGLLAIADNLNKFESAFNKGFGNDLMPAKALYTASVFVFLSGSAKMLSLALACEGDFALMEMAIDKSLSKKSVLRNSGVEEAILQNIVKIADLYTNGTARMILAINNSAEGFVSVGGAVIISTSLFAGVLAIREIIFLFYYMRNSLSDYLRYLSEFVDINSNVSTMDQNAVLKQQAIAKKLSKAADFISAEEKSAFTKASNEIDSLDSEVNKKTLSGGSVDDFLF